MNKIFTSPSDSLEDSRNKIITDCDLLQERNNFVRAAVRQMEIRAAACVIQNGG